MEELSHQKGPAKKKYDCILPYIRLSLLTLCRMQGFSAIDMLVIHPAYWRRGHGSRLAKWGLELSRRDGVKQGVMAASTAKQFYTLLGFQNLEDIHVAGDEIMAEGVTVSAMLFDPASGSNGEDK